SEMEAEIDGVLGSRLPTFADMSALPFTRAVLDESLRLRPPAWLTGRICTKSHDFDGIHFEEGQLVLISPWVVHHRADVYDNPDTFDPSRWARIRDELPPMAFFPFGGGARKCVGEAFAYLEAILTLAMITQRMRLELAPGSVVPLPQITLGFAEGLQMKVIPRVPRATAEVGSND
ncbi:MAG: cytochrome P450, partial [Polyangiales bacterium]